MMAVVMPATVHPIHYQKAKRRDQMIMRWNRMIVVVGRNQRIAGLVLPFVVLTRYHHEKPLQHAIPNPERRPKSTIF
jgi:hypothetical protein